MFKWIFILGLSNNRDMIGGDEKVLGVVGGWAVRGCGRWSLFQKFQKDMHDIMNWEVRVAVSFHGYAGGGEEGLHAVNIFDNNNNAKINSYTIKKLNQKIKV
jgi:hypothetical protein